MADVVLTSKLLLYKDCNVNGAVQTVDDQYRALCRAKLKNQPLSEHSVGAATPEMQTRMTPVLHLQCCGHKMTGLLVGLLNVFDFICDTWRYYTVQCM